MQTLSIRIILLPIILVLISPFSVIAAPERRTALIIGNGSYHSGPLKNPVNDATDMAVALKSLDFDVVLKTNARMQDMEEAIRDFGNRLKRGGEGLFFYAGHAVQINGKNYLIPIGANVTRETDAKYQAIDAEMILDEMANAGNHMNIMILDACRDNPLGKSFRSASRGLAIISDAPQGMLITYSTSPGKTAADGEGRNSPYTAALLRYMTEPGQPVEQVFKKVRQTLTTQSGGRQIPWELSSLQGNFFFAPGAAGKSTTPSPAVPQPEMRKTVAAESADDLELAMAKIRRQQEDNAAQRDNREEKFRTFLTDVKKYKTIAKADIDVETKTLAWKALIRKYPSWSTDVETGKADKIVIRAIAEDTNGDLKRMAVAEGFPLANEIARDGHFIAYDNGTVLDTKTMLMWAAKDNGADINWANAKSYCENYRGGGYTDWRMPMHAELKGLYDEGKSRQTACKRTSYQIHVATELIDITCLALWASETSGSDTLRFRCGDGLAFWQPRSHDGILTRALPVRAGK